MTEILYLSFLWIVFRLKALTIYLDIDNDRPEDIKKNLRNLRVIRLTFFIFYVAISFFLTMKSYGGIEFISSETFEYTNLIISVIAIIIILST